MIKIIIIATDHLNSHIVLRKMYYNPYLRFSDRHHRHHSNQTHPVLFLWRPLRLRITCYQIWSTWSSCVFLLKMKICGIYSILINLNSPTLLPSSTTRRRVSLELDSDPSDWEKILGFNMSKTKSKTKTKTKTKNKDEYVDGPHLNIGQIRSPSLSCVPTVRPRCSLQKII